MLTFVLWAIAAYVVLVLINMLLPIPLGVLAEGKWSEGWREAEKRGEPIGAALPTQTLAAVALGLLAGVAVALVMAWATVAFASPHWFYQLCLLVGFFAASSHAQNLYLLKSPQPPSGIVFGRVGDRLAGAMFGGYF